MRTARPASELRRWARRGRDRLALARPGRDRLGIAGHGKGKARFYFIHFHKGDRDGQEKGEMGE